MGSPGRKSKATDQRLVALLGALRAGNTRSAASAYAEVSRTTFYRWIEDVAIRDAVEKAEADAEVRFASQVAKAATNGTWQAAAWWLERRRPDEFGRRDRVEMTVDLREIAARMSGTLDPDEVMAEAERILADSE